MFEGGGGGDLEFVGDHVTEALIEDGANEDLGGKLFACHAADHGLPCT